MKSRTVERALILMALYLALPGSPEGIASQRQKCLDENKQTFMDTQNFMTSFLVDESPQTVFNAVTNVRAWWSEEIEGGTTKQDDIFNYHYKDIHRCRIQLTEVIPDKRVVWYVLNNYFNFTADKSEWVGTRIVFDIATSGGKTKLSFTHEGLTSADECYNVCRDGWTNYINNSLYKLITRGKGEPNPKEGDGFNAELARKWNLEQ